MTQWTRGVLFQEALLGMTRPQVPAGGGACFRPDLAGVSTASPGDLARPGECHVG